jgi:hypothetical protein
MTELTRRMDGGIYDEAELERALGGRANCARATTATRRGRRSREQRTGIGPRS